MHTILGELEIDRTTAVTELNDLKPDFSDMVSGPIDLPSFLESNSSGDAIRALPMHEGSPMDTLSLYEGSPMAVLEGSPLAVLEGSPMAVCQSSPRVVYQGSPMQIDDFGRSVAAPKTGTGQHRRRAEANFACPVPGCASTFTRHFNLKGQ